MPITDSYGQNVTSLAYGEVPDLVVMGTGLLELAGRSVMRFANASARNATLTAPTGGMTAFLVSEKLLTIYDGSAWVTVASSQSTWTQPVLASGFTHDGNSNGPLKWRLVNMFGEPSVWLQGAVGVTYSPGIPNGGSLLQTPLPASARPSTLRTMVVPCSDSSSNRITMKLDARTTGELVVTGTNSTDNRPPWIGFNGIIYNL